MRRFSVGIMCAAVSVPIFMTSCGSQPTEGLLFIKSAKSISSHYVLVEFSKPASKAAESPLSYSILDSQGSPLGVQSVELSARPCRCDSTGPLRMLSVISSSPALPLLTGEWLCRRRWPGVDWCSQPMSIR
jgi:hypothetical protein